MNKSVMWELGENKYQRYFPLVVCCCIYNDCIGRVGLKCPTQQQQKYEYVLEL